jgi:hypothetical protein
MLRALSTILILALIAANSAAQQKMQPSFVGAWEGPLVIGRDDMTMSFTFSETDGAYSATLINGAKGIYGMPADSVRIDGLNILIRIPRIDLEFTGTLRLDENEENYIRIDGDWFQQSEMIPVVLYPVETASF